MPFIHSIRTGVPVYEYTQDQVYKIVAPSLPDRLKPILNKILKGSQIRKRHFVTSVKHIFELSREKKIGEKFKIWQKASTQFFEKQIKEILSEADLTAEDIDGVCTCTTSGFVTPGIDVLLMDTIGFRKNITRLPLFGYGCSGGMAAINRVDDYLAGNPTKAFLVCVGETLSMQYEHDNSISKMVSNNLFGDGFATLLMVGKDHRLAKASPIDILETRSYVFPDSDFAVGQWMTDSGLKTHVDYKLPKLIKAAAKAPITELLLDNNINVDDIEHWILHTGGPKVMDSFCECLALNPQKIEASLEVYKNYGNQSAVSVLSAMENSLATNKKIGYGFMMALGPGIHMEYALCQVDPMKNAVKRTAIESAVVASEL